MCDNDRSSSVAAEVALAGASSSFSSSSLSSWLPRSPVAHSRRFDIDPGSEAAPERDDPPAMCLATAERLYRCLGVGRAARAGDVLLQPERVSRTTLRRWRRSGWIVERHRVCLTTRGCAALPFHQQVVAFAQRSGRSTLFL